MNDALRIILATTMAQDASAANAAHGEALADTGADQFFRCTATAAECLADGRAGIDALTDAADEQQIDYEAIAWAYSKLIAFGVGATSQESALMLDRLNLMLLEAA